LLWVAGAGLSAAARADPAPTRVTVTIRTSAIVFAPRYVPSGAVAFTVFNRTRGARDFGVGARRTRAIAAGRSTRLTLALASNGERTFSSLATAGSRTKGLVPRVTGALYLFEPCKHPAATTVEVSISTSTAGLMLSQTMVPCGTVTFAVTDVDTTGVSLLVTTALPPLAAETNELDPGGTATLTVRFVATAVIDCDAIESDAGGNPTLVGHGSLTLF
jgi:hypothetical protein